VSEGRKTLPSSAIPSPVLLKGGEGREASIVGSEKPEAYGFRLLFANSYGTSFTAFRHLSDGPVDFQSTGPLSEFFVVHISSGETQ
jgi:hypothetical protein